VEDFIYTSLNSIFVDPYGRPEDFSKIKSTFLGTLNCDFRKNFCERSSRRDLPKGMTTDPLPPLGAEPGAPKILGQPKKSPTSGYRGSKFLPPKIDNRRAHKFWGSHFRLASGVLPPGPKNPLSRATFSWSSGRQISIKLKIYTLHTSRFSK